MEGVVEITTYDRGTSNIIKTAEKVSSTYEMHEIVKHFKSFYRESYSLFSLDGKVTASFRKGLSYKDVDLKFIPNEK